MEEQPANPPTESAVRKLSLASLICMAVALGLCLKADLLDNLPGPKPWGDTVFFFLELALLGGFICGFLAPLVFIFDTLFRPHLEHGGLLPWLGACALFFVSIILFIDVFFEPSVRSPVARVKGDQRTLTIALETYYLDNNEYPAWTRNAAHNELGGLKDKKGLLRNLPTFTRYEGPALATLTTPISYISSYFSDPFAPVKGASFCYWTPGRDSHPDPARNDNQTSLGGTGYIVWSAGPDHIYDLTLENIARLYDPRQMVPSPGLVDRTYDPSNGTASAGDVYRYKQ